MALVAYGSSDESEGETEDSPAPNAVLVDNHKEGKASETKSNSLEAPQNGTDNPEDSKFDLPQPVSFNEDVSWNLLSKNKGKTHQPVKILIPQLTEIEEEAPVRKIFRPSMTGCGLFAVLPPPKSEMIPQKLTPQQINKAPVPSNIPKKYLKPEAKKANKPTAKLTVAYSDSEDEEEAAAASGGDFFALAKTEVQAPSTSSAPPQAPEPTTTPAEQEEGCGSSTGSSIPILSLPSGSSANPVPDVPEEYMIDDESPYLGPQPNPHVELNDEALSLLCGRQAKRFKKSEEIELIDVNGDNLIPDAKEWLTKELTTEQAPTVKPGTEPSSLSKRKHQITYLAHQAKVNEVELKNQWAQNRMSRKQTQSKYGF